MCIRDRLWTARMGKWISACPSMPCFPWRSLPMRQTTARSVGKERFRPSSREAATWQNNRKKAKKTRKNRVFCIVCFFGTYEPKSDVKKQMGNRGNRHFSKPRHAGNGMRQKMCIRDSLSPHRQLWRQYAGPGVGCSQGFGPDRPGAL